MFRQRRGTLKAIEKQAVIVTAFRSLVCQEVANNTDGNSLRVMNVPVMTFYKNKKVGSKTLINVYSNKVVTTMHI